MKIVNTPKQRAFFCHTALNFLAIRQDACENLPCLAKKFLAIGHIANYQTSPRVQPIKDYRIKGNYYRRKLQKTCVLSRNIITIRMRIWIFIK